MSTGVALLIILFAGALIATIASHKRRSVPIWFVFGAMFPLIALVTVLCVPSVPEVTEVDFDPNMSWR